MSQIQILLVRAEGEDVAAALELFSRAIAQQAPPVPLLPAGDEAVRPSVRPSVRTNSVPADASRGPARRTTDLAPADREIAILKLLKFRALRIPEIADALCADKRQVKAMVGRLYPAMAKLKKQGKVKKDGAAWALK